VSKIVKQAAAGTLESSDALVIVKPVKEEEMKIEISSVVKQQYQKQIERIVYRTLEKLQVRGVYIKVEDRGALDCTLAARIETAVCRAMALEE
jgi:citrate lyase subunit gamma (acyl carrier protein)